MPRRLFAPSFRVLEDRITPSFGALISTIANPSPGEGDIFASSVSVSGDNVFVGAPYDSTKYNAAGSAYLFNASAGALLKSFENPAPYNDYFNYYGISTSVSGEYLLVGAL